MQPFFILVIIILIIVGATFLFVPEKVKSRLETSKNIHIRLVGILIIIIAMVIIIQQSTISSLIYIISGLKNK